jgi:hypothetical protein
MSEIVSVRYRGREMTAADYNRIRDAQILDLEQVANRGVTAKGRASARRAIRRREREIAEIVG